MVAPVAPAVTSLLHIRSNAQFVYHLSNAVTPICLCVCGGGGLPPNPPVRTALECSAAAVGSKITQDRSLMIMVDRR